MSIYTLLYIPLLSLTKRLDSIILFIQHMSHVFIFPTIIAYACVDKIANNYIYIWSKLFVFIFRLFEMGTINFYTQFKDEIKENHVGSK